MTPTNKKDKVEISSLSISKTAIKLQIILEDKGYTCKILTQGQCCRQIVGGVEFSPPEFPIRVEFGNTEPSNQEVLASLLAAILEHIQRVHNYHASGSIYVTLRDPDVFEMTSPTGWLAHISISVLSV